MLEGNGTPLTTNSPGKGLAAAAARRWQPVGSSFHGQFHDGRADDSLSSSVTERQHRFGTGGEEPGKESNLSTSVEDQELRWGSDGSLSSSLDGVGRFSLALATRQDDKAEDQQEETSRLGSSGLSMAPATNDPDDEPEGDEPEDEAEDEAEDQEDLEDEPEDDPED